MTISWTNLLASLKGFHSDRILLLFTIVIINDKISPTSGVSFWASSAGDLKSVTGIYCCCSCILQNVTKSKTKLVWLPLYIMRATLTPPVWRISTRHAANAMSNHNWAELYFNSLCMMQSTRATAWSRPLTLLKHAVARLKLNMTLRNGFLSLIYSNIVNMSDNHDKVWNKRVRFSVPLDTLGVLYTWERLESSFWNLNSQILGY